MTPEELRLKVAELFPDAYIDWDNGDGRQVVIYTNLTLVEDKLVSIPSPTEEDKEHVVRLLKEIFEKQE